MFNFTIIKLSLCVLLGVILGFYLRLPISSLLFPGVLLLAVFIFAYLRSRQLLFPDGFFGILVYLLFLFFGISSVSLQDPMNYPSHYIQQTEENPGSAILIGSISEKLKPGSYQDKYIFTVTKYGGNPSKGKILLNISRDSLMASFEVGQRLAIAGELKQINSPLNPFQFNYRQHMEKLGVYRQTNVHRELIYPIEENSNNFWAFAGNFREGIIAKLRTYDFAADELAIINALLLGQRQEISQEIYSNYAAAGVIHILAVSGLHVGIILLILNKLLEPLERVRSGRLLKLLLLLFLLWGFALLAGLSPSVVRAVSMFSFVAVGMQLKRRTSVINTLFMSMMVLLLLTPGFIRQVGFQLSYAAVFSIVLIQPHIYGLYKGDSVIIKYFWGLLSVTFAAQIGVLPLSLFYFNQFPGLFFISNLVILPFLGIILGLGILVLILARLDSLPAILADLFGWMINSLNQFVTWAASNEKFIFENIGFSLLLCLVSYLIIIAFISFLKAPKPKALIFILLSIIIFQGALFYERSESKREEFLVFHKSRNTVIGKTQNDVLTIFHDLESPLQSYSFIKDYTTHRDIDAIRSQPLGNIMAWNSRRILRIDEEGVYDIPDFKPEIILLTNSPKVNMERLLSIHTPEIIIADGSNYPSFIKQWKETSKKKNFAFHTTSSDGAFILKSK